MNFCNAFLTRIYASSENTTATRWARAELAQPEREVIELSHRLASALSRSVRPGDRVATIVVLDRPELFAIYGALWRLGSVIVPLIPQLNAAELAGRLRHAAVVAVITTAEDTDKIDAAAVDVPSLRLRIGIGPAAAKGWRTLDDVAATGKALVPTFAGGDALATIIYTGGSTGQPKGVMLTHHNLLSGVCFHAVRAKRRVSLLNGPLAHIGGIVRSFGYLAQGDQVVLVNSTAPDAILRAIQHYRVQVVGGPPSMYVAIVAFPDAAKYDMSTVESWTYAAGGVSPQ